MKVLEQIRKPSKLDQKIASESYGALTSVIEQLNSEQPEIEVEETNEKIKIPLSALKLLGDILKAMGQGKLISLVPIATELTTQANICFDTETTGIDANDAELVGLSFSVKPGEAYYIPCPADQKQTKEILSYFDPLFSDKKKTWIGQNTKYDLLVLKWYGIEITWKLFDTMLAHYVI